MVHPAGRPPGAAGVAAVAVVDAVDAAATPVAAGVSAALPPAETKFIKPPRLGGPPPPSEMLSGFSSMELDDVLQLTMYKEDGTKVYAARPMAPRTVAQRTTAAVEA